MFFFNIPNFSNLGKKHGRDHRCEDLHDCGKSSGFAVDNFWMVFFVQILVTMSHCYPQEETDL